MYLKYYHLKLASGEVGGYWELAMLDEAQDTTPCVAGIAKLIADQVIFVGDSLQQLYMWRGAVDAMSKFKGEKLPLMTSFRFGSSIANLATDIANRHLGDSATKVTGARTTFTKQSYAFVARKNSTLFDAVFNFITSSPDKTIELKWDISSVWTDMFHIEAVSFDKTPKFPSRNLSHINSSTDLRLAIDMSQDLQRLNNIRKGITAQYGGLFLAKKVLNSKIAKDGNADRCFSTIHASKGLEWDVVEIAGDVFEDEETSLYSEELTELLQDKAFACLLYVAVTRAKTEVILPYPLHRVYGASVFN
jgi:superfamily I DNA/RNA helicase